MAATIIGGVLVFVAILVILANLRVVRPIQRGLVERFGKYQRFAEPGLVVLIPFGIENLIKVNVTEQMVSSEKREIITADSLNAVVDSNVYFKVKDNEKDVKASIYNVNNYQIQIVALAKTTLRNIIGTMTLKEANSDRNKINRALYEQLAKETQDWGIEIVRTELKEIQPPKEVQEVMNSVVVANNQKIAASDFATATETKADGERRAKIKIAEGERQAMILQAEGHRQSLMLKAEGEAQAIKLVNEAAEQYFIGNAQELRKLQAVEQSLSNNAKVVLPASQSLINVIGSLADLNGK
jgi:regulator of protease activity HflC (stomatin/prohibitin superfamily)